MKKILFSAYNLDLGGIETALITLLNFLAEKGYDITLVLEKKEGVFLNKISEKIKIVEYSVSNDKNLIKRKFVNFLAQIKFKLKYNNKFDFSASFATYSIPGSFVARTSSKNSALWGHADYLTLFNDNKEEMRDFFVKRKYNEFEHVVFVSEEGKNSFLALFPEMESKTVVCNNLINAEEIIKRANENVTDLEKESIPTFVNIGRHDEKQKKLSRIIEATCRLKAENEKLRVILVGDGKDTRMYKEMVKKYDLEDYIIFLGRKENPYPYFNLSDCVILSSDYEGYPVVYLESFVLNKPIITTKLSDYEQVEGRGIVVEKNVDSIYNAMKNFIKNGYVLTNKFDYKKYNEDIIGKIENLINNTK